MRLIQGTLDELGTPLSDVEFVVVDLETTGGAPGASGITEVGAVRVRGGQVLGEFQTLVDPGTPIPPFIALLTGITDAMVRDAPRIESVLPAFLEFARGSVLVAHNAPFDVSFLKAAARQSGHQWPGFAVVDTVHLARQIVTRDEVPNRKLSTLARLFGSPTTPDHRALTDARATVHVLHGLLERVGSLGVRSLEELATFSSRVSPAQRRKRHLAEPLPSSPGVYLFRDANGSVLYVGTSRDIRTRVRSYFTASETRTRMAEMVAIADRVDPIVCATPLEAEVRELRLIAEHKPRYNRRSRFPERQPWVKLTVEPYPRLSIVGEVRADGATYLGPFGGRRAAEQAVDALHEVFALRQCTRRMGRRGGGGACALAEMGRCAAPCTRAADAGTQHQASLDYEQIVRDVRAAMTGDCRALVSDLRARIRALSDGERFEQAALVRDRLVSVVRAAARVQRIGSLASCPEIVAARRPPQGGWEIVLVRHGRLAGTTVSPRGSDPWPYVDALRATGEVVEPPVLPAPASSPEEAEKLLRWLEADGTRLVDVQGAWSCPLHGAGFERARLDPLSAALSAGVVGFEDRLTGVAG
ncbi:DEDD exonuclease domain-containing protein [Angustibacter sp. McL0619]|uniref:DEDD exonuclease domain-containing protein n=1 Tax=Angustibacter sp. McL0619 TaxID=3415676 RepID=UPI003CF29FD9